MTQTIDPPIFPGRFITGEEVEFRYEEIISEIEVLASNPQSVHCCKGYFAVIIGNVSIYELLTIIPKEIEHHCEKVDDWISELYPIEKDYIVNATHSRKIEFSTGRKCARVALGKIPHKSVEIPPGKLRLPIFPKNITGSITHDAGYCIAGVAKKEQILSLGLDLCINDQLDSNSRQFICTPEEIEMISSFPKITREVDYFKVIFSIKESIFKCYFHFEGRYFDFQDVSLALFPERRQAEVRSSNVNSIRWRPWPNIRYNFSENYIVSVVWI